MPGGQSATPTSKLNSLRVIVGGCLALGGRSRHCGERRSDAARPAVHDHEHAWVRNCLARAYCFTKRRLPRVPDASRMLIQ